MSQEEFACVTRNQLRKLGASHEEALEFAAAHYSNDSKMCKYQINAEFKDYGLPVAYPLPLE